VTVSGIVTLSATATDNVGVASVTFLVDGAMVGSEDSSAPYSMQWNSNSVSTGAHTIRAVAVDFAGNSTTSAPVQVTVVGESPATHGQWSSPFSWPLIGLHAALLRTGEVISWEFDGAGGPYLWNPVTNQFTSVSQGSNLFCAGHSILPDGRLLVAGGHIGAHVGITELNIFNPITRTWTSAPDMSVGRWYTTVTGLPDGRALITAGEVSCSGCNALIPEIYNPATNAVSQLTSASFDFPYYPHTFVMPDGRVLVSSTAEYPIASQITWPPVHGHQLTAPTCSMVAAP
jgi:hypothetical protein